MGMYIRTSPAQGAVKKVRMYARLQTQSSWSMHSQESGSSSPPRDGNSVSRVADNGVTSEDPMDFMRSFVSSQKTVVDRYENNGVQREARARELVKLLSLEKFQQAKSEVNKSLIQETNRQKLSEQLQMAALQGKKKDMKREQDDATKLTRDRARPSPLAELFHGLEKAAEARERHRQRAAEFNAQGKVQSSFDQADIKKIVESIPVSKGSKNHDKKTATPVRGYVREERKTTAEDIPKNQQRKSGGQQRIISNIPNTELPKSGYLDLVDEKRLFHSRLSLQEAQARLPLGHKLIRVQLEGSGGFGSLMVVRIIKKRSSEMTDAERTHLATTKVSV
ncbi:hypothetical protein V1525DRAFT_409339 [Lipomyces kononenkoae]|uniref:Uncharacterized protein n=1 Tax=Lipomyces kononenkoae TaxID=34357 RepID=A0ACC3SWY1_LIPKO